MLPLVSKWHYILIIPKSAKKATPFISQIDRQTKDYNFDIYIRPKYMNFSHNVLSIIYSLYVSHSF